MSILHSTVKSYHQRHEERLKAAPEVNLEKHFSLNSSNLVKKICDPLLQSIGITYFNYIKI